MNIVAAFPPSNREATAEICNEHANKRVNNQVPGNGPMASVMRSEHDLVLYL